MPSPKILVINCGSSSIKFALIDCEEKQPLASGLAECLGSDNTQLKIKISHGSDIKRKLPGAQHKEALKACIQDLKKILDDDFQLDGVGHRVVHGGEKFTNSCKLTEDLLNTLKECSDLAPLHNPANLTGIYTAQEIFPGIPQIAVFDTSFHQTMPPQAYLYATPYEFYEKYSLRRYGFHGTSHHYVAFETAKILNKAFSETNIITIHLGNGCSVCSISNGQSVDTSMGLSPNEGLVMGTRSGDVDPSIFQFLAEKENLSMTEVHNILNQKSGLLGISGLSNDMRTLIEAAHNGHSRAQLALNIFCHRLSKSILSMTAGLDVLNAIVFTGGIGENAPYIRAQTILQLRLLQIDIDPHLNDQNGRTSKGYITTKNSTIPALVVPTNEELMIAREATRLLKL
ncbi:MAG: acetate kinase [Verrucomicrobiota bacterium]